MPEETFVALLRRAAILYQELHEARDWHEHGHAIGAGTSDLGTGTTGSRNPDRRMLAAALTTDRTVAHLDRRLHAYGQRLRDMIAAMEVDLGRREPRPPIKGPGRGVVLTLDQPHGPRARRMGAADVAETDFRGAKNQVKAG